MCANLYSVDFLLFVMYKIRERSYHQVEIEISACINFSVPQFKKNGNCEPHRADGNREMIGLMSTTDNKNPEEVS